MIPSQVVIIVSMAKPLPMRDPDWAESHDAVENIKRGSSLGLLVATEPMAALSVGWQPPSLAQVQQ